MLSNAPTPEAGPAAVEGTATWAFETGPVISSYIVAIIAGPYAAWHGTARSVDGRDVPLGLFTRASLAQYAEPEVMFGTVQAGLAFYEQAFGVPYPYGKYDQIFVPEYNWGAMENVGAVTFNESYLFRARVSDARREQRAIVVLHELSHMWFGNSVTMQWWNDLWLNESFATWASTLATSQVTEFTGVWATFASDEKTHAAEQDQLPSTHPIVAEIRDLGDVEVNFDAITYDKGASVLKQLVAWVGLEAFQRGVGAYLTAHAGGNATLRDLLDELERASGRELTRWSELWLETAGVNTLRAVVETDAAGTITAARVEQSAAPSHPTLRPHRLAIGCYSSDAGRRARAHPSRGARRRRRVDRRARTRGPAAPRPAPRERRRPHLRQGAARSRGRSPRPSAGSPSSPIPWPARSCSGRRGTPCATPSCPRASSCDSCSAASATRPSPPPAGSPSAGSSSPSAGTSPTITASGSPSETGDAVWALAELAETGSDAQLQFVKAFTRLAATQAHADVLGSLLDGSIKLPGLDVDLDLRWELVIARAALGAASDEEIDGALALDDTAKGRQLAETARAARPDQAVKDAAWRRVATDTTLSNDLARAIAEGWRRTIAPELLASTVAEYFELLQSTWASRSFTMASLVVSRLFPAPLVDEELAAMARAWLDANPTPAPLHRLVSEQLDELERALAARARDASVLSGAAQ